MAIGWATVDMERTLGGLDGTNARVTDDDLLLGARAWRVDAGPVALILLEPNTEGRLAAALARNGEGIVALYLRSEGSHRRRRAGALRHTALGLPGRVSSQRAPMGAVPDPSRAPAFPVDHRAEVVSAACPEWPREVGRIGGIAQAQDELAVVGRPDSPGPHGRPPGS